MNILKLPERKAGREKIVMVTCYDYTSARIIDQSDIDIILVGDSAAMVMHGYETTLPIDTAMMALHVAAVRRGAPAKFIVADLPFLSYRRSVSETMQAVAELMRAGAQAVKLEGIAGNVETIHHIVESGVPVMGHIGLTPQSINTLGTFRAQGRDDAAWGPIEEDARAVAEAGAFSMVIEAVAEPLARKITVSIDLPTIGIGASAACDGQVLVLEDMLGLSPWTPKFVKRYGDLGPAIQTAIETYAAEVRSRAFPGPEHVYAMAKPKAEAKA